MPKKPDKKFRVRNRFHQVLGEYSERELLSRIKKGKFQGDEDVAQVPEGEWKKISTHTKFFDAFLKRIVEDKEGSAVGSNALGSSLQAPPFKEDPVKEQGKTEHLGEVENILLEEAPPGDGSIVGGTLRKSDLDKLFDEGNKKKPNEEDSSPSPLDQPLLEIESPPNEKFEALSQPLNPAKLRALAERLRQTSTRRRRMVLASVLLLLLAILFQSGKDESVEESVAIEGSDKNLFDAVLSEKERKERVAALFEEARVFYSYDSLIDYKAAQELASEGLGLVEKHMGLLSLQSQTLARIMQVKGVQDREKELLENLIAKGREIEPHHSGFYRAEAIFALASGKKEEARGLIQAAVEADPTDAENMAVSAEVALAIGDIGLADVQISQAIKLAPTSVRAQHIGSKIALQRKNFDLARKLAGESAKLNPLHADSYTVVGDIQSEKGDIKNAKVLYELTVRLGRFASVETLAHAHERLARYYEIVGSPEEQKKHEEASSYYKSDSDSGKAVAEAFFHDRSYFEDRGRELIKERKNADALRFYQAIRVLYPRDTRALVRVGEVMEKLASSFEDFRKVMLLYERAARLDKKNPEPLIHLAALEVGQYNFARAQEFLERAEQIAPESAEVHVAFGKYYFRKQDYVRARDYLSKAGTLNPTNAEVYYYYGVLTRLYKPDLLKEASRHFYQAYILDVSNYDALCEWLKLRVEMHEKNFAVKFVRNLLDTDPTNAELYWVFGEVYAANGETRRAITYYHKALDIDNRASKVRMSLGKALASVGEAPSAVEEYVLASRLDRKNPKGFFEAAQLLFDLKRMDFSEDVLKKLLDVTPNYPGAQRLLARVYQSKGKKELAIEAMKKEVENNPFNYKFAVEFAELYMVYQEFPKAIEELKRVTSLPPETKAPEFRVERVRAYLLLSRCLRAQNKSDSAEGAIKSAIQIDPTDPELKRELGYVYHALQRDKEATEAFNYYLERNPAAQDAAFIKTLIKKMGTDEY